MCLEYIGQVSDGSGFAEGDIPPGQSVFHRDDPNVPNDPNALNDPNASKKMIRTQIQIHAGQMKWLKKHALENGISMSQAIRDSIDFYRLHVKKSRVLYSKKKKALKAVGTFSTSNTTEAN